MGDPDPATTTLATIKSSDSATPPPPEIDLSDPPFPLSDVDRALLATPDADFQRISWTDLQSIISSNKLEELKRTPDDSKRYLTWSHDVKKRYGNINKFILEERLGWTVLPKEEGEAEAGPPKFAFQSAVPFEQASDFTTLRNDWPYGFTSEITHLLVWSKTPIPVDDDKGDVTAASRRTIVEFVERFFVRDLEARGLSGEGEGWEKVLWFKNWVSLQSVRGVDHVHVLVRDVPREVVEEWCTRRH